ncbi:MAG: carbon storage regulator [Phycisphaerae bacterium]
MDPPVCEETLRFDNLLSISRKAEVRVVSIRQEGSRVRLGVKAPRSIPIVREEAKEQFLKNQVG